VREPVRLLIAHEHGPVERRHRPRLRGDAGAWSGMPRGKVERALLLRVLKPDVAEEDGQRDN